MYERTATSIANGTVVCCWQANTLYVENEIDKLNGDQLVELKVFAHFSQLRAADVAVIFRKLSCVHRCI